MIIGERRDKDDRREAFLPTWEKNMISGQYKSEGWLKPKK